MATWVDSVLKMAAFYKLNVHTYQGGIDNRHKKGGRKTYSCGLIGHNIYDDCSGFVSACLWMFGAIPMGSAPTSGGYASNKGTISSYLRKAGFSPYTYNAKILLPFDIVAMNGHVEIYAGLNGTKKMSYGWGNRHDGAAKTGGGNYEGMPCSFVNDRYAIIWRNSGVNIDTPIDFSGSSLLQSMNEGYGGSSGTASGMQSHSYNMTADDYPIHGEYETYSGSGGNVFDSAINNAISIASIDSSYITKEQELTRIYSTNDASIILDSLTLPMDYKDDNMIGNSSTNY